MSIKMYYSEIKKLGSGPPLRWVGVVSVQYYCNIVCYLVSDVMVEAE